MTGSLQTLLSPGPAGSQLLRKSSSPYLWPKARSMHWGPCGNFKFSSFGQLQVSLIAESLGFKVLFPTSCRAVFLSHVLPSPTLLACATAVLWLSLLFLHAVPFLATLPPFVSTSLPSILPLHCLHPSQLTLYCHTADFHKFGQVSFPKWEVVNQPTTTHCLLVKILSLYPLPFLPSSFCLSWLTFCLLLNCKLFEGSARIWSGFYKAPHMLNIIKGAV